MNTPTGAWSKTLRKRCSLRRSAREVWRSAVPRCSASVSMRCVRPEFIISSVTSSAMLNMPEIVKASALALGCWMDTAAGVRRNVQARPPKFSGRLSSNSIALRRSQFGSPASSRTTAFGSSSVRQAFNGGAVRLTTWAISACGCRATSTAPRKLASRSASVAGAPW